MDREYDFLTRLILNTNRADEILQAIWDLFDLDERMWFIPARRIKGKISLIIPLSDQSIPIINRKICAFCISKHVQR